MNLEKQVLSGVRFCWKCTALISRIKVKKAQGFPASSCNLWLKVVYY